MFNYLESSMKQLSVQELVKIAQGLGEDPVLQFSAVKELDLRKRMNAEPQPQQKTVLESMALQAQGPQSSTAAPGDPIMSGIQSILQAQTQGPLQAAAPVRGMRDGGRVGGSDIEDILSDPRFVDLIPNQDPSAASTQAAIASSDPDRDIPAVAAAVAGSPRRGRDLVSQMESYMERLGENYLTEGSSPEDIQGLVSQFMPDNSKAYARSEERNKNSDAAARSSRNSNLWLALAQAGLGLADRGRVRDAMPAFGSAERAIEGFNEDISRNEDRRSRTEEQSRAEGNTRGAQGLAALLQSRGEASAERRSLRSDAAGLAETEARIAESRAARAQEIEQVRQLAGYLMEANAGRIVQSSDLGFDAQGQPTPSVHHYNEQDAIREALIMSARGGRGGSQATPDDLSELTRMLDFRTDSFRNNNVLDRDAAMAMLRDISNAAYTERIGRPPPGSGNQPADAPTGTRAPSESRRQGEAYARQRPAANQPDGSVRDLNGNVVGR